MQSLVKSTSNISKKVKRTFSLRVHTVYNGVVRAMSTVGVLYRWYNVCLFVALLFSRYIYSRINVHTYTQEEKKKSKITSSVSLTYELYCC